LRHFEFNLFLNHNYRVLPRLTLDWGLRYERNTTPREMNGRIESALTLRDLPAPGDTSICGVNCGLYFGAYNNAVEAYRDILDGRTRMYEIGLGNFSPRLGFALGLEESMKTVVRGGYGIYYDAILGAVVSQSRNVFPEEIPFLSDAAFFGLDGININSPEAFGVGTSQNMTPFLRPGSNQLNGSDANFAALVGALFYYGRTAGGLTFTLPEKHLRTPYVQQWHVSLEKEAGAFAFSGAYVGTKGTHLLRLTAPNGGPSVTPYQTLSLQGSSKGIVSFDIDGKQLQRPIRRNNPALGAYQIFESSASSSYHALQLELKRRFSRGFALTGAYTWAHAIDDCSDVMDAAGVSALAQNASNLRAERGNAAFDVRHKLAVSAIAKLPSYHGGGLLSRRFSEGWQVASIFVIRSGQPFTLQAPFDANQDGNLNDRPLSTDGLIFLNGHGQRRIMQVKDTSHFFNMELPSDGQVSRNSVRADSLISWDLALEKSFSLRNARRFQFRMEAFNVLNRSNFGIPIRTIGDPGFGLAVNTATPARIIQLAAKLSF
jgi:hypothetical protein